VAIDTLEIKIAELRKMENKTIHMSEDWGSRSLCGWVLKANYTTKSLPYGSSGITCSACKKEFLKREQENRTLNYYSFVAGRQ
jgi:hypothetical protein